MASLFNFNRLQLSTKMMIGTAVPLILIVILATVSFFSIRSLEQSNQWVDHTYQVLGKAANIEKLVVDLETGERGFLITGKESFLEPFHAGRTKLTVEIREL
jgi:methyl-accepting chemotaxis protein